MVYCSKKIGFTLGKYSPLHRGHQFAIETALSEMDEVYVVVYPSPETTTIPLRTRADWIGTLYPAAKVVEAFDGPTEVGDSPEIVRRHNEYLARILIGVNVTHFYSSEFYGEYVAKAFGAVNRLVDPQRKVFPVSGSLARKDPFKYIHPVVYRDLVCNVVFLGAPCTGKTAMASTLAKEFDTQWMPEYGREYWEKHQVDRRLTREQLVEIATTHVKLEDRKILESNRYLFTDTNAIATFMFSLYYHGEADERLRDLADRCADRYQLVYLCEDDFPYVDTWDRSGEANRTEFQARVRKDLEERKIPYVSLRGALEKRIAKVKSDLRARRPLF